MTTPQGVTLSNTSINNTLFYLKIEPARYTMDAKSIWHGRWCGYFIFTY
ncbi:hypothetical protein P20495_0089 [Pseudoalteromonas sp. BSi20495]|nr:hypothetical protein P20495_0089 [Pseudoalteromonas sp. BSi20495]